MRKLFAALGLALAISSSALAQSQFPTAGGGGPRVPGGVIMCLDGSGNAVPATAAGTCLGAGGGGGSSQTYNQEVVLTPTIASSSHVAGSSLGGLLTLPFFRNTTQPSGIVNNVQWIWKTGGLQGVTVYLFNANPTATTCTDATAISIGAADIPKLLKGSPFTLSPGVVGSGATFSTASQQLPISTANFDGTKTVNLYGCVAINTTATPPANDGVFGIAGPQD